MADGFIVVRIGITRMTRSETPELVRAARIERNGECPRFIEHDGKPAALFRQHVIEGGHDSLRRRPPRSGGPMIMQLSRITVPSGRFKNAAYDAESRHWPIESIGRSLSSTGLVWRASLADAGKMQMAAVVIGILLPEHLDVQKPRMKDRRIHLRGQDEWTHTVLLQSERARQRRTRGVQRTDEQAVARTRGNERAPGRVCISTSEWYFFSF